MSLLDPDWPGIDNVTLTKGAHPPNTAAWCFQEAIIQNGYAVYGEDWDAGGISLVLRQAGQRINDGVDDLTRQSLLSSVVTVMNSSNADPALEKRRQYVFLDGLVREFAPAWLDFIGKQSYATQLRNRPQVVDAATARSADVSLRTAQLDLRLSLASKSAVVGPPTSTGYRAYNAIIGGGGLAYVLASDLPAETLIRSVDNLQGNVDSTTANRTVFGADANGAGGFQATLGLVAIGCFRRACSVT
jgi:hypothetical protein